MGAKLIKFGLIIVFIAFLAIYLLSSQRSPPVREARPVQVRTVYLGSTLFRYMSYWEKFGFERMWNRSVVTFSHGYSCQLTNSSSKADAIILISTEVSEKTLLAYARTRTAQQRWVFYCPEPVPYVPPPRPPVWSKAFNWTVTYKRSADIQTPYHGRIYPRKDVVSIKSNKPAAQRRLAFAVISNCLWKYRLNVIKGLQAMNLSVDLFGKCGTNKKIAKGVEAIQNMSKKYFFYLAFENNLCTEYITEKFWNNGLGGSAVPVVIGGLSRQEYEKIAPPNSFIYAHDFNTVRELGAELRRLANNATAYDRYQRWRRRFKVKRVNVGSNLESDLCYRLHTDFKPKVADFKREWDASADCRPQKYLS